MRRLGKASLLERVVSVGELSVGKYQECIASVLERVVRTFATFAPTPIFHPCHPKPAPPSPSTPPSLPPPPRLLLLITAGH